MPGTRGKPRKFKKDKHFYDKFTVYLDYCGDNRKFVNIAGFCRFCEMTRETYYQQKNYYPDTYARIEIIIEDETLNTKVLSPQERMWYLKNKFPDLYKDKHEVEQHNIDDNAINKSPIEEKQELQQLLKKHNMTVLERNNSKLS